MDENKSDAQEQVNMSKYELKQQRKEIEKKQRDRSKIAKKFFYIILGAIAIGIVVWRIVGWASQQESGDLSEIVASNGMHWHSNLEISIRGKKQEIPGNIGIGVTHVPMHTHDTDDVIHMEFSGLVREDDLRLGRFFEIWRKEFSSSCIFEFCNGDDGMLRMLVNDEPNEEFMNYIMQDGDKIKIIFE
jgi:hypothetical protein